MTAKDALTLTQETLLNSEKPSDFFEELRQNNQLDEWFPELGALIGVPQNREHHKEGDVWTHTMMVLAVWLIRYCSFDKSAFRSR